MERLVFGLEYQNAAGEEIELIYTLSEERVYYIEDVRVVPYFKAGGAAYGYSGDAVGEYHVTVDTRKAPFTTYEIANDNRCPKMCLTVSLMAVCSHIMKYIGSRASLVPTGKAGWPTDKRIWWRRSPF